ncbi:hypothetical protein JAO71_08545 [Olleya sp. YSTF-M6]|uniref:Ada DNA repair metal-binding domain-containing protein n=1 Tax=Olleya sediminilitoris TaxID=2795739 RepID=A0ABS1WL49_9FLAO|nr:hypothetical protein [Olleya sediminilitoris]MBL7559849.1 hypothetical protein [Olleya sediminilitoris]
MKALKIVFFFIAFSFGVNVFSQTVYTTKTGEKYHKSTCHYLKYSKKEYSLSKAITLGFKACLVCKPNNKTVDAGNALANRKQTNITPTKATVAKQCTGKTKAGKRCKRKTKNVNQRCYQH